MNDVNKQEEIRTIATVELKSLGVKYRYKKHRQHAQDTKSRKAFKTPLHSLPTRTVTLESGQQLPIPKMIQNLCSFVLTKVETEGLFRKGGSKSRQNEIKLSLDAGCSLGDEHHEVDVASVLKTFFRELPEPLIPSPYHDLFLKCVLLDEKQRLNAVLTACLLLPIEHLNTLTYFMQFLHDVSSHNLLNKMTAFNLAVVFGPTLLPPPDEKLVQTATPLRLSKTTELFLLLIDNCQMIGALSERIISQIRLNGKENKLDFGDAGWLDGDGTEIGAGEVPRRDRKKKKRRSGSLTRMFSGLKKIVGGKETSQSSLVTPDLLMTPVITRSSKKRKIDNSGISQKKRREIINGLPQSSALGTPLLSTRTPISNHPNVKKNPSPDSSVKSNAEIKLQSIKEKKTQWYSRSKPTQKNVSDETSTKAPKLMLERRWSAVSQVAAFKRSKKRLSMAATSDNNSKKASKNEQETTELSNGCSGECSKKIGDDIIANNEQQYVRISKHEYEDIKQRVSEIERRISIELDAESKESGNSKKDLVTDVQVAYEQTLEDADALSPTTDQLAKRFSRELKIRRSTEAKVIRSPSARKIGGLRRKSRERLASGNKLSRNLSWHITTNNVNNNFVGELGDKNDHPSTNSANISDPVMMRRVARTSSLKTTNLSGLNGKSLSQFSNNNSQPSDKWMSAEGFFRSINTPNRSLETCRASIAKIRAQNAGMVLAKARIFDNLVDSTDSINSHSTSTTTTNPPPILSNKPPPQHQAKAKAPPTVAGRTSNAVKIGAERDRPSAYRIRALKEEQRRDSRKVSVSPGKRYRVSSQVALQRSPGTTGSGNRVLHRRMRVELLKENARNDVLVDRKQISTGRPDPAVTTSSPRTPRNMPNIKRTLNTRSPRRILRTPARTEYPKTPLKVLNTPLTSTPDLI